MTCRCDIDPASLGAAMAMHIEYEGYPSRHEEVSLAARLRRDRTTDVILRRHRLRGPAAAEKPA